MANPTKAQFLADVLALLKKRYKIEPNATKWSVLEAIVYAICHENASMKQADEAFGRFKSGYFDWNEVRVSSIEELMTVFAGMGHEETRANRLRRFLRQMFEKTYGFNLDALAKKPLKESVKTLQEYEAFHSDYMLATVSRLALGGHAIGLDEATLRVLARLGISPVDNDLAALRSSVERAVPKNRGEEFTLLMEEVAADVCFPSNPNCPACELKKICPTGQERLARPPVAESAAKTKATAKDKAVVVPVPPVRPPAPVEKKASAPAPPAASKDRKPAPAPAPAPVSSATPVKPAKSAKPKDPRAKS